jgi:hypothetical protein
MWFEAIRLPTPRLPEWRNSQTRSRSSAVTSMKWLPEPRLPSCIGQFGDVASTDCSTPRRPASSRSSATRFSAVGVSRLLYRPADRGTARSMSPRSGASGPRSRISATDHGVRTAIMPQPMSTPTAAGMIASRVGSTEPTVAPLPRCASGMSATCGWTIGSDAVRSACRRVS